ncbi:MAG: ribonuclease HI [Acidobacteriota bacterium]
MEKIIEIYTDGACSGNQFKENSGGWGAVLLWGPRRKEIYGGEENTTNNRMELTACIKALDAVKQKDFKIIIYSDSSYIVNCFNNRWYVKWEKNGWKNSRKEPVENKDLWIKLLKQFREFDVKFVKVKGHSGIELNEEADRLANKGMNEFVVQSGAD